jgi:citrate synthase
LVGHCGFTDCIWLLITGNPPSSTQRRMLDAALVAIAEHGLVPSVQASRMTLAAAPESFQGAVAAGILGCGSVILGAAENAGRLFAAIRTRADENGGDYESAARATLTASREERKPIAGYGHPLHKGEDPRASRLLEIAREEGLDGAHIEIASILQRLMPEIIGKPLALNVSGAIPAVLLDAGFPVLALKGIPILARTAGLIGHLLEEQLRPVGFVLSHAAARAVTYEGPVPTGFRADEG